MDTLSLSKLRRVNLTHLISFVVIADTSSFRAAAAQLHVSQSALSVHIRQLEAALGVSLFHRTTRSVTLTRAGERVQATARRLCGDLVQVVAELREEADLQRGETIVATLPSLATTMMPRVMREFATRHPGIVVRLRDVTSRGVVELLQRGEADIGVLSWSQPLSDLTFQPLVEDDLLAVLPNTHPLSKRARISLNDLAGSPLLLNPRGVDLREMLEVRLRAAGLAVAPVQEIVGAPALVALVSEGLGVAILPEMALPAGKMPGCTAVRIRDAGCRQIGVAWLARRSLSPATDAFRRFLVDLRPASYRSRPPQARR
jgi:LysR family carnitine catabolism transcriptional activator